MTYEQLLQKLNKMTQEELQQTVQLETYCEVEHTYNHNNLNIYQIDLGCHGDPVDGQFVFTTLEVEED